MPDMNQNIYKKYRDTNGDIIVRYAKLKLLLLILGCALFIITCLFILNVAWGLFHSPNNQFFINFLFGAVYVLISFVGILFFGSIGVMALYVLLTNKPNLSINQKGLTLIGFRLSPVFIAWHEIAAISPIRYPNNKNILLDLIDMEKFMATLSPIQRWVGQINIHIINTPVAVSSAATVMSITQLHQLLCDFHGQHSNRLRT